MADPDVDICRVCRCEGTHDKPLFYPCVCTGSIKYVHQECLVQWLKYSKKEFCELCKHKFSFTPIYAANMPKRLPLQDILTGLAKSIGHAAKSWFHYTLVAIAWLGVVPLTACRICRCLFTGSVNSLLMLPLDMLSTENVLSDILKGTFVVLCSLCVFISLVWLREQLVHDGAPQWLLENPPAVAQQNVLGEQAAADAADGVMEDDEAIDDEDDENDDIGGADAGVPMQQAEPNAPNDDNGAWNPIEWDRAAEELTWERLLGLDGSLVFLEHVFWVVSLNTLFVLVFAFCPYHIGHWTIAGFKLDDWVKASHFESVVTAMVGYLVISIGLVILHAALALFGFKKAKKITGMCYIVVKVTILIVVEIGLFPLICGWWLDICSLSLFNTTLRERSASFESAPGTSTFLHWLVGMVYVFYFASSIILLREILRPGVLWFMRNVNDPDFNPISEMIHISMPRHVRRFVLSLMIFGTTVLLVLWLPTGLIQWLLPSFLPYQVTWASDAPVSEFSLDLLLLQVVLPAFLEQGNTHNWLKELVRGWTMLAAWLLDLRSYLLGDVMLENGDEVINEGDAGNNGRRDAANHAAPAAAPPVQGMPAGAGVGEAHQAILNMAGPTGFKPYKRPRHFHARIVLLIGLMCLTLYVASSVVLVVPVAIGRWLTSLWPRLSVAIVLGRSSHATPEPPATAAPEPASSAGAVAQGAAAAGASQGHELYTAALGAYTCWLLITLAVALRRWLQTISGGDGPARWLAALRKLRDWTLKAARVAVAGALTLGVVPTLLGVLFELVVVVPLRVAIDESPILFVWQDWALGVLHTKIICALIMVGPNWWLKQRLELMYNNGMHNMNLGQVLRGICVPVICILSTLLAAPYAIVKGLFPWLGFDTDFCHIAYRRVYPVIFTSVLVVAFMMFHIKQFKKLYEHIKNDKYLVGQQLVNYNSQGIQLRSTTAT